MSTPTTSQYVVSDINFVAPHFPQYAFHHLIAEGQMGAVFKALQSNLDREVAFKVIARRIGREDAVQEAFQVQARAVAKLSHINIVKVFDFGEAQEMLYMVQEYVAGSTLDAAAGGVKVDIGQVLDITIKLCRAIAHAHENGVIHGDLQPKSIFITPKIETKIADFGLAMTMRAHGRSDISRCNPAFISPEVLRGDTHGDVHSDIFSVGAICYYLLTADYITSPTATVASAVRGCDQCFDAIIGRAISVDPAARYQSMHEMLADITALSAALAEPEPLAAARQRYTTAVVRTPKFNFPKAG